VNLVDPAWLASQPGLGSAGVRVWRPTHLAIRLVAFQAAAGRSFIPYMRGSPFRFRLERVRELRERREDEAKRALASAMADHFRAEEELRAAELRIESARAAQLDATRSSNSGTDLVARQAYLERTETAAELSQNDFHATEAAVAGRRDDLTQAARDRQALERLKERRHAEHVREAARAESVALDEIAINNFRRRAA
jgi:flagellar protein FliJ